MTEVWQQTLNWQPDTEQQQQFQRLYELILQGNQQLNLTRITDPVEFWEKHLWDSLRPMAAFWQKESASDPSRDRASSQQRVIDIGTGAGFPGVPAAIAQPLWTVTLLDSTRKKIAFLDTILPQIGLQNAKTLVGRAEQLHQQPQHRASYDIALIRAVGAASVCAEYALPFLKVGGLAIAYRGHWTEEEATALTPVVERLGGVVESIEPFTTPLSHSVRHGLYLRKVAKK